VLLRLRQLLERLRRGGRAPSTPEHDLSGLIHDCHADLGVAFNSRALLCKALTHRSALQGNGNDVEDSNERLEFLGDSVLELVVNEHLFRHYPDKREGDLTKMKSLLVSRSVLARRAVTMKLGRYLFLSQAEDEAGGRTRPSILADAYEAVLGAVYLDRGFGAARLFVKRHLLDDAEAILADQTHANFKNMLQELVQAEYKTYPRYRTSSEDGPDHKKQFTVEVMVHGKAFGAGKGANKKQAEQEAAKAALGALGKI